MTEYLSYQTQHSKLIMFQANLQVFVCLLEDLRLEVTKNQQKVEQYPKVSQYMLNLLLSYDEDSQPVLILRACVPTC